PRRGLPPCARAPAARTRSCAITSPGRCGATARREPAGSTRRRRGCPHNAAHFRGRAPAGMNKRGKRLLGWGLFTLAVMMLSGVLLADHLTPKATGEPSHALPVEGGQTLLDQELAPLLARHPGQSGVVMLADGLDAFAARAISTRRA